MPNCFSFWRHSGKGSNMGLQGKSPSWRLNDKQFLQKAWEGKAKGHCWWKGGPCIWMGPAHAAGKPGAAVSHPSPGTPASMRNATLTQHFFLALQGNGPWQWLWSVPSLHFQRFSFNELLLLSKKASPKCGINKRNNSENWSNVHSNTSGKNNKKEYLPHDESQGTETRIIIFLPAVSIQSNSMNTYCTPSKSPVPHLGPWDHRSGRQLPSMQLVAPGMDLGELLNPCSLWDKNPVHCPEFSIGHLLTPPWLYVHLSLRWSVIKWCLPPT